MYRNNPNFKEFIVNSRLNYFKPNSKVEKNSFADEISEGLNQNSKFIQPKFFYDSIGSRLFEKICSLPEYYPTRTEISILKKLQSDLPNFLDGDFRLIELGSGSSTKTRLILDILSKNQSKLEYFPIDISEILTESSELLLKDYPKLKITGIIDTYDGGLEFLKDYDSKNNLIIFLGSSYGNFSPDDGLDFLIKINSMMKSNDLFLIGLDLVKDKNILESAYNDSQNITAEFNLNVLNRINNELDANFVLENFRHYSIYNDQKQRIEMYVESLLNQTVTIGKSSDQIYLKKNELIHTEFSHKFQIHQIENLLKQSGFNLIKIWLDDKQHYSLSLASKN
ncbi:MAG: L-histidine N(alpha)-methyltransferase [Nitrosopumilus sp.]|jgi:L-histidine N-alpha-methyltransferase